MDRESTLDAALRLAAGSSSVLSARYSSQEPTEPSNAAANTPTASAVESTALALASRLVSTSSMSGSGAGPAATIAPTIATARSIDRGVAPLAAQRTSTTALAGLPPSTEAPLQLIRPGGFAPNLANAGPGWPGAASSMRAFPAATSQGALSIAVPSRIAPPEQPVRPGPSSQTTMGNQRTTSGGLGWSRIGPNLAIGAKPMPALSPIHASSPGGGFQLSSRGSGVGKPWTGTTDRPLISQQAFGPNDSRATAEHAVHSVPMEGRGSGAVIASGRRSQRRSKSRLPVPTQPETEPPSSASRDPKPHSWARGRRKSPVQRRQTSDESTQYARGSHRRAKVTDATITEGQPGYKQRVQPNSASAPSALFAPLTVLANHSTSGNSTFARSSHASSVMHAPVQLQAHTAIDAFKDLQEKRRLEEGRHTQMRKVARQQMQAAAPSGIGPSGVLAMHLSKRLVENQKRQYAKKAVEAVTKLREMETRGYGVESVLRALHAEGCQEVAAKLCKSLGMRDEVILQIEGRAQAAAQRVAKGSAPGSESELYITTVAESVVQLLAAEAADSLMDAEPKVESLLPRGAEKVAPVWLAGASVLPLKHALVLVTRMAQAAMAALPPSSDGDGMDPRD